MTIGTPQIIEPFDGLIGVLFDTLEELHLVEYAAGSALLGGPVVGGDDDQGVVELADLFEERDQAADLARRCGP